jgi:tetratricopeptide (TPR) repeat protein
MTHLAGYARLALFAIPIVCLTFIAAAPPLQQELPEELVRRANEQFRAGNIEAADALYTAAEERTRDPGLVAFNRAAILFERGQFREAEKHYERVLTDDDCPPERAAKAWYNRGTCLLRRGGSMDVYRSAIACFEHTIDSTAADEPLKADARHNLEIAKLLWLEEAKKEQKKDPPSPNENIPPEEQKPQKPEPDKRPGEVDANANPTDGKHGEVPKVGPQQVPQQNNSKPTPADQNVAANNPNLVPLEDKDQVQSRSPEDAREYLKQTSPRRKRELHSLLESLYGSDRADVQDW